MKNTVLAIHKSTAGAALLTALGLLFIFLALGVGYVTFMVTNAQDNDYSILQLRAKTLARAGVQAGIAELQKALAAGTVDKTLAAGLEFELPVYGVDSANPQTLVAKETPKAAAKVAFLDESGKVNINHAPPRVLQAVLGVDGDTARRIRSSLPVQDGAAPGAANGEWMASLDDLLSRGLLSAETYAKIPQNAVSVVNVADHKTPDAYLNLNAAAPAALAAVFDLTPAAAEDLAKKRPFASFADAAAATGKDPSTFNLSPTPDGAAPKELTLESRCFRVESNAELKVPNSTSRNLEVRAEAVVIFAKDGTPTVTFWSETPEPKTAESKPAAQ